MIVWVVAPEKNWPSDLSDIRVFESTKAALAFIHNVTTPRHKDYTFLSREVLL